MRSLLLVAVSLVALPLAGCMKVTRTVLPAALGAPGAAQVQLAAWQYPGSSARGSATGDTGMGEFTTPDAFQRVWTHYATRVAGRAPAFGAGMASGGASSPGTRTSHCIDTTLDPRCDSALMLLSDSSGVTTIQLLRPKASRQTTITVAVAPRAR